MKHIIPHQSRESFVYKHNTKKNNMKMKLQSKESIQNN
ncbi:unnamed protein product [Paramecium octaurelia]|uniref:Uncharacterized protein n=1 Tax=Paramecium octaurelia TaxID=43137 RepID=A0A8S1USS8_PAROT|nr:unnamed protein product [Paramecium octaurelia]